MTDVNLTELLREQIDLPMACMLMDRLLAVALGDGDPEAGSVEAIRLIFERLDVPAAAKFDDAEAGPAVDPAMRRLEEIRHE
jgi:hypothetical protein